MHAEATSAKVEPGAGGTASTLLRRLAAVAAVVAVVVLALIFIFDGDDGYSYRLVFTTGGQLVPDNQVMIGGHPVGSVDSIDLDDKAQAIVDVTVDQQLHRGTTAVIRATSLAGIANRYVSISPGPNNEPAIEDGSTLGPEPTTSPVDVDQLFDAFGPRRARAWRDSSGARAPSTRARAPPPTRPTNTSSRRSPAPTRSCASSTPTRACSEASS